MSRILEGHIIAAERKLAGLNRARLEARVATLFREQPLLLSFIAGLSERGVSKCGIQFLYRLLAICHQAMKESGGQWPVIAERRSLGARRLLTEPQNSDEASSTATKLSADDYWESEPERFLRSYVDKAVQRFHRHSDEQGEVKRLATAALHIVDSIAAASVVSLDSGSDRGGARKSEEGQRRRIL